MTLRSLGLAAVAAVAADAILLPPSMSTESVEPELSTWTLVDPNSHLLVVPCQGCTDDNSNVLLNLTVGAKPGTIELGGEVVYPVNPFNMHSNPKVLEVPSEASLADIRSDMTKYQDNENVLTGWLFGVNSEKISEVGDEIVSVNLEISSIGSHHVNVPQVDFKILKNPENHMMILSSSYAELQPGEPNQECTSRICKFRQMIEDQLNGIATSLPKGLKSLKGGCHRGMKGMKDMVEGTRPPVNLHHGPHSHHDGANRQPLYNHGPHHPQGGHHRHHHHSKVRSFLHHFARVFMAVALPILVGIAAGFLTYAVGMVIGCTIALIWIKFRRGGRRGYQGVALDEDDAAIKEMDLDAAARESFESAPPVYEHAPAYEEKEVV